MNAFDGMIRPGPGAVVAEIQGLYGAFSFPEKLLQKVWLRGDFDRASARLMDGRDLRVGYPGKWNLLGGPDFKGARIRIGDREITGDVEIHLHAVDWDAHRHAADPAYAGVRLHVVLFPPAPEFVTRGEGGGAIPTLVLLPLLLHDLEEYAAAEAVETLANRPGLRAVEELGARTPAELTALIRLQAQRRWRQKLRFAGLRLQRLGWSEACHHLALEILGYRFTAFPCCESPRSSRGRGGSMTRPRKQRRLRLSRWVELAGSAPGQSPAHASSPICSLATGAARMAGAAGGKPTGVRGGCDGNGWDGKHRGLSETLRIDRPTASTCA